MPVGSFFIGIDVGASLRVSQDFPSGDVALSLALNVQSSTGWNAPAFPVPDDLRRTLQGSSDVRLGSKMSDEPVKERVHRPNLHQPWSLCQQGVEDIGTAIPYPPAMADGTRKTTVSPGLLKRWLKAKGRGAQADFARRIGETDQVVGNWLGRGIPKGRLHDVTNIMGIAYEEYIADPDGRKAARGVGVPQIVEYSQDGNGLPATFSIPRFQAGGGMDPKGRVQPELETIVGHIEINRQWIGTHLPGISSPKNLRVITGFGDSMADTYQDGDFLFVDVAVQEIHLDAVYVFSLNKELFIKRLQRRPDGALVILSDNKKYDPYVISRPDKTDIHVHGRVVWAWNGRKL